MNVAHFQYLADQVVAFVAGAQKHLQIAVCWFSHRDIFEALLRKIKEGVAVDLIIEYDTQNIHAEGLDFQKFIKSGGCLYARREAGLMHHKFAIADGSTLLNGSYNWTYNSNAENILISDDPDLIHQFQAAFLAEKAAAERIFTVKPEMARPFATWALFENTQFALSELRRKVGGGAGVWVVKPDKRHPDPEWIFTNHCVAFDAEGLLRPYWMRWPLWDADLFKEWLCETPPSAKPTQWRHLRRWTQRIKTGDILFAMAQSGGLKAVGVVQSHPKPNREAPFSTFRAVQWLKILSEPVDFEYKIPPEALSKFRGSGLKALQKIFS